MSSTLNRTKDGDGYECPSCGRRLLEVAGTMFYRGRYFAGLVCWPCRDLRDNPDDSMIEYAKSVNRMPIGR